jgi:transcriptional regulator with XRE-family HTH domain
MLVGAQLRRLREDRRITRDDAAKAIRASPSKLSRLELGRTGFKQRDVADLLTLYGVANEAERMAVLDLAKQANEVGWWQSYDDVVPAWFESFLGLEQAASVIRTYEVQFVPGLLQTRDYARAVIMLSYYDDPEALLEQRVELRIRRLHLLTRPDPPLVWAVIDETALRRPIGGIATLRGQLRHLLEIAELPHVSVQVMPLDTGGHPAAGGPVTLLRLPETELPDVVYLEQLTSARYLDKPADVLRYRDVMNRLGAQAAPPSATREILYRALSEL